MTWVRADFFWYSIESGGPNSWNWGPTDAFVKAVKAHHLHVLAMLGYTPSWARSGGTNYYPPKNPADFANFARTAACGTRRWACTRGRSGTSRTSRCSGRRRPIRLYVTCCVARSRDQERRPRGDRRHRRARRHIGQRQGRRADIVPRGDLLPRRGTSTQWGCTRTRIPTPADVQGVVERLLLLRRRTCTR